MSDFTVTFKDGEKLVIHDIIHFDQRQIKEIAMIAVTFFKHQLRNEEKYGKDLSYILEAQKKTVLDTKNKIIRGKTATKLLDEEYVQVAEHSNKRILQRVGSDQRNITLDLVEKMRHTDKVTKAQFKGHGTLSYTTMRQDDLKRMKLPISFIPGDKGKHIIKMITVALETNEAEEMETSISESDPEKAAMLAKMRERLKSD